MITYMSPKSRFQRGNATKTLFIWNKNSVAEAPDLTGYCDYFHRLFARVG